MQNIVRNFAGVFLFLFVGIWVLILWEVWSATGDGSVQLSDPVVTVAGFLSSSVGAATAAILGIEVQKITEKSSEQSLAARVRKATATDNMVAAGVYVYGAVGVAVLVTWLVKDSLAPELVKSFALGALGWLAGAFSATFKAG